jgi:hypothetical protein
MAKGELPLKGGGEYDALTRWKRFLNWRSGVRAEIKRKFNKRVRKAAKLQQKAGDRMFRISN